MNSIERFIYNKVRFSPKIKKGIVNIYQRLFSIIPIKKIKSDYNITVREGYFFGFHDKCPWSYDNKLLLAHKYNLDLKMPAENDKVEIGYFSGDDWMEFKLLDSTSTWNWQMGSMLQWVGDTDTIIFNDFDGKHCISKIIDVNGKLVKKYKKPIAAVSPDGNLALSHSFIRLREAAPAYGYANGDEKSADSKLPNDDGIYILDLKTGKHDLLFSLSEIANSYDKGFPDEPYHYFTHCLFSPSGKRFAFYHRWVGKNNQTWTRLLTCKIDGTDVYEFDFSGVVTHLAWQDDMHLLAYGLKDKLGDYYYLLTDKTNNFKIIGEEVFTSDGHPQFSPDKRSIITDSYPDRLRRQYLINYNIKNSIRNYIAVIKSPLKFTGDIRCDLHPRWDRLGKYVAFDSSHTGERSLCTVKLVYD